jgi:hypothetical protein
VIIHIRGLNDRPHRIPLRYGRILIEHVELPASSDPRINLLVDLGRAAGNLGMAEIKIYCGDVYVLYLHVSDRNISEVG